MPQPMNIEVPGENVSHDHEPEDHVQQAAWHAVGMGKPSIAEEASTIPERSITMRDVVHDEEIHTDERLRAKVQTESPSSYASRKALIALGLSVAVAVGSYLIAALADPTLTWQDLLRNAIITALVVAVPIGSRYVEGLKDEAKTPVVRPSETVAAVERQQDR